MEEYAEKLIRQHCMRMAGNKFREIMFFGNYVPQRRNTEGIIPDLSIKLQDHMVVRIIDDRWIKYRRN